MPVRMPIIARLPACVLLLAVAVYTVSFCTGRMVLVEGTVVALLMLPCLWLVAMPGKTSIDATTGWFLVTALVLEGWMAGVQALSHDAVPAGWWCFAERAAGLCTLLLLVGHQLPVRVLVQLLGAAASCTLVVCAVMNGWLDLLHPLDTDSFAFGHVNILANTAGPSLLAWLVVMIADWRATVRPSFRDLALAGCGLLSLAVITVSTQRRGVVLACGAGCAFLAVRWLITRHRRLGITVVALLVLVMGGMAVRQFSSTTPSLRSERITLYRSGLDGIISGAPFGFGHYGALHLQLVDRESCRHMTADGGYGDDIHNQLLESALDGGPVALVLVLVLIALVATRVMTISDRALRPGLEAMGVAILMHLLTDNVYGTEVGLVWLSVAVGMMLTASSTHPILPVVRWLPSVRVMAWPLALVSLCGALLDLRVALLPVDAGASERFRCLQTAFVPQSVSLHAEAIIQSNDPTVDQTTRDQALDLSVATMGWTIRTAIFEAERRRRAGPPAMAITAMLRVLRLSPFFREYYELLSVYLSQHPEGERLLPQDVHQRLTYLRGGRTLPKPVLSPAPRFIDEAIDEYTAIIWSISNDVPWTEISQPLHGLVARYGDVPGVTQLALMAVCAAPSGTFPWLEECVPQIAVALRGPGTTPAYFGLAQMPDQARRLLPIAERLYPEAFASFAAGSMRITNDPVAIMTRLALVRLWGLAHRQAGLRTVTQ